MKNKILKKVLIKLASLNNRETEKILFDNFVDREEIINENFYKKIKMNSEKLDILKKLYSDGKVKKSYFKNDYTFGFEILNLKFDINISFCTIKKINN
jgi:hypothetical protein